ncbi:MAG TPA: redoxin domain-containing protein, partial [Pirellulaceae bacterium]|nr:redoxin domain-containing protein [Pirellulaceae bacterium]
MKISTYNRQLRYYLTFFASCAIAAAFNLSVMHAEDSGSPLGRTVAAFSLSDYRGREFSLDDFSSQKLMAVAFLGTECPLAKLYGPRLNALADEFASKGVAFVGINSNTHDSNSEIAAYVQRHAIEFPLLKDLGNRVADAMGAQRTPEVFLLDQDRVVRYWGRIDDQYGVGYSRDEPTRHDLRLAIEELLSGLSVSQPITEAVGCHIGRIKTPDETAVVTYSNQVARIFQRQCVECHRPGEIAPFSLTNYDEVVGWADTISEVIEEQRMPPWHAKGPP